jgi:hypothetical protein
MMKKFTLFLAMIALTALGLRSQTLPYSDNFESYTVGGYLAVQNSTWWTTWDNTPGSGEDAFIKNNYAHSPAKSVLIDNAGVANDLILKLGGKTTGKYELTWWTYIEIDKSGYYSILHTKTPAAEYGMSVYFRQNGAGELFAGGSTPVLFNYPKATWFKVKHLIDLDADNIKLYINGSLVHEWPFSYQDLSTTGTKQLNSVDFFPGIRTGSGETPKFYFDDVFFGQISALGDPIIGADPVSISEYLKPLSSSTRQLTISNTGPSDLDYNINIIYKKNSTAKQSSIAGIAPSEYAATPVSASSPVLKNAIPPGIDATAVLKYDGDNFTAVGWNTPPVTVTVAARYPNAITLPFAGMSLESVDVYISQLNTTTGNQMTLLVYGMGTASAPGALLQSQTFNPVAASMNHITLTTPVYITGEDLWVGYKFTQNDAAIHIPGTDAGPNNPNGDFLNMGAGWEHLSLNTALAYNWNIRANLNGTVLTHWLSVNQTNGTIAPAGNDVLTASFSSSGLSLGLYDGIIRILSDDPTKTQLDIPCQLSISVGINEPDKIAVMIYPNPAEDKLNILSNDPIFNVTLMSSNGKILFNGKENTIDIRNLTSGAYIVQMQTAQGVSILKFTKK